MGSRLHHSFALGVVYACSLACPGLAHASFNSSGKLHGLLVAWALLAAVAVGVLLFEAGCWVLIPLEKQQASSTVRMKRAVRTLYLLLIGALSISLGLS